jgi:hypothetical protein
MDRVATYNTMLAALRRSASAHSDHASHAATRGLIPPTPRPRSFAPSATTPLYSTAVSKTLRQGFGSPSQLPEPQPPPPSHGAEASSFEVSLQGHPFSG